MSSIEQATALLKEAGYQVIEPFQPPKAYCSAPTDDLRIGVVLDTETTGKDPAKDRIIELGMVFFEYDPATATVHSIVDVFDELQDPGFPIPAEATAVNGITDEMVRGKTIDGQRVTDLVTYVDVVIAHNAAFDRAFCEAEWPVFKGKAWACSVRQVDWEAQGISSAKLEYVAYKRGFHYEAHRAEMDCRVLLHVLQGPAGDIGQPTLKSLLDNYRAKEVRLWAIDAPYHAKDVLKERGYYWGDGSAGKEKAWYCQVPEEELAAELTWLKANGYGNRPACVVVDTVDAFSRFSPRREGTKRQYI